MDSKLRTPNSELRTIFQRKNPLEEILLQLTLDDVPASPKKILFRGEGAGEISSYVAGWMAGQGCDVIVLDGANRFDPYTVSSFARKALIPPERLLKMIRVARAFTCYQMATLIEKKLPELIGQEGAGLANLFPSPFGRGRVSLPAEASAQAGVGVNREDLVSPLQRPWVILLGPITTFSDGDVPEREVRPLFERSLKKMEEMAGEGIPFFLFQSPTFSGTPPFSKGGVGGLINPKREYLSKRLAQFSDLVWRIEFNGQGVRVVPEKIPKNFFCHPELGSGSPISGIHPIF